MQITKTLRGMFGKDVVIFNDRLLDGTRSVKIWGWSLGAAKHAEQRLKKQGLAVKLIETRLGEFRLHVKS